MKLGIISDTHGCLDTWEKIYDHYLHDTDLIIHAGDVLYHGPRNPVLPEYNPAKLAERINACPIPMMIACGNCDAEVDNMVLHTPIQSPYTYVMIEGKRIVINHGHTLTEEVKQELAKKFKADIFITGHTHVAVLEKKDGIIFLNPGSPAMTKRPDKKRTIALMDSQVVKIIDIDTNDVLSSETL